MGWQKKTAKDDTWDLSHFFAAKRFGTTFGLEIMKDAVRNV